MTKSKNPRPSEEQVRRANELWNTLPHYGDLVAENHSEKCPLFKNALIEATPAPQELCADRDAVHAPKTRLSEHAVVTGEHRKWAAFHLRREGPHDEASSTEEAVEILAQALADRDAAQAANLRLSDEQVRRAFDGAFEYVVSNCEMGLDYSRLTANLNAELEAPHASAANPSLSEDQIKYMVNRFLGWRLPENFNPDAGISFQPNFNEETARPMRHEPTGTNLFDATQVEEMVRYLVDGITLEAPPTPVEKCGEPAAPCIPQWGMYFLCVLPKGHEGEHKRGGNCFKHGEYAGEKCPQWPDCSTAVSTGTSVSPGYNATHCRWCGRSDKVHGPDGRSTDGSHSFEAYTPPAPEESRSVQKRKAAQRGEPMPTFAAPASQPVSAPVMCKVCQCAVLLPKIGCDCFYHVGVAAKKEWVTEGMESAVFRGGGEWREALNELLAPRIEAHIAAAFQKCVDIIERSPTFHNHSAIKTLCWCDMCSYVRGNVTEIRALTPASVAKALELAEVRAALTEAEWWCRNLHREWDEWYPGHHNLDNSECLWCKRFDELKAREAELLARGGAKP